jgi:NAD(P)-dependent dehydrogenase (short-subunit alcohol dehydrogenase family)
MRLGSVSTRYNRAVSKPTFFQARYAHAPLEQEKLLNQIPLRRLGQPDDIADAVAFLASDWAAYITGQILLIDGGRTYQ